MAIEPLSIEAIKTNLVRLQAELKDKNSLLTTLAAEKAGLLQERNSLSDRLSQLQTRLDSTKMEFQAASEASQAQIDALSSEVIQLKGALQAREQVLAAREKEVTELKTKYAELVDKGSSNQTMLNELAGLRLENEFHKGQLLARNQYYQQVSIDLEQYRSQSSRLQAEMEGLQKALKGEQERRSVLEQELNALRGRSVFGAAELTDYLNHAIDTFNGQSNVADCSVNYIISELQVDLKAGVATTGTTGLTMVAPHQTQLTEQGLSSFKFTIRAVPQTSDSS